MSKYTSMSSNPFEDDGKDDFSFGQSAGFGRNPFGDKRQQFTRLVDESEERQLESTQRAISSLYESEAMGNATAEELLRQREVINSIDKKTDEINQTLTTSQRHINNIKSVFGGIKNWWGGRKDAAAASASDQGKSSSLDAIVKRNSEAEGEAGRGRGGWGSEDTGGYGSGSSDLDSRFMAQAPRNSSSRGQGSSLQYVQPITRSAREEELDKNLGLMSDGLGRLKNLAMGLGDEIEQQTESLERLNPKVNRANDLLDNQNKQMGKILKR